VTRQALKALSWDAILSLDFDERVIYEDFR